MTGHTGFKGAWAALWLTSMGARVHGLALAPETDPNLHDIRAFYPLSLMHFFDYQEIGKQYVYPLKALNLFEVVYWVSLANGIHFYAHKEKKIAWIIVLSSYVLIFLLWLIFYVVVYK